VRTTDKKVYGTRQTPLFANDSENIFKMACANLATFNRAKTADGVGKWLANFLLFLWDKINFFWCPPIINLYVGVSNFDTNDVATKTITQFWKKSHLDPPLATVGMSDQDDDSIQILQPISEKHDEPVLSTSR
jgi:hypothetical protein